MNKLLLSFFLFLGFYGYHSTLKSQCVTDENNVVTFTFEGKTYEIIKESKTWDNAQQCAIERGGYLVEINSQQEQDTIWKALGTAGLQENRYSIVGDGGGASYIWIGATDVAEENKWIWAKSETNFWNGLQNGILVEGQYANWGKTDDGTGGMTQREPDNSGEQDVAAIGLTGWPLDANSLGVAGQWNDIMNTNELYFIVEKDPVVNRPFTVTTKNATRVTSTKGILQGEIINEDSLVVVSKGFMWKGIRDGDWLQVLIEGETNILTHPLTELTPDTTYMFYSFAQIEGEAEAKYGDTLKFKTRILGSVIPISDSIGSIKPESAMLYGIIDGEPANNSNIGFEWKKSGDNDWKKFPFPLNSVDTLVQVSHRVTGLIPNTNYVMRFFINTEVGDEMPFKTIDHTPYVVTTNDAESIDNTVKLAATVTQRGTDVNATYTFDYKISDQEVWKTTGTVGTEFTITLRQLESAKQYTFRAVITTADTIKVYGEEKTFTSPTISGIFDVADKVDLKVYPNPATSYVNVRIADLEEASELLLINMTGQILKRYQVPSVSEHDEFILNVPVSDLPRGLYYIQLNHTTQKLMVE